MSDIATIRRATGGYILTVRWPLAGEPVGGGEMVCATFDEVVTALYQHLHPGEVCQKRALPDRSAETPCA